MSKKQRHGRRATIRVEEEEDDETLGIEQVEKLLGRDRRSIRRWRTPRLTHCEMVGRTKFYRLDDVIRVGRAHGVAIEHQPSTRALVQSRAVALFRQGKSVDEAAEEVPMYVGEAARVFRWWEAMAGLVTFRAPAVRAANHVLTRAAAEDHHLHLGIHVPGKPGLTRLLDSALRLLKSHPQCMADRDALEREAGRPIFSEPAELERELEAAAHLPPSPTSSRSRTRLAASSRRSTTADEADEYSRRVSTTQVAEILGLCRRQVERISKQPQTPLPVRVRRGRGRGRGSLFDRADVTAYLNARQKKEPVVLPKRERAAKAAKLLRYGHSPDAVMVQLQMSCAETYRVFLDWAHEHAACLEGHLPLLVLEQMEIRGLPMWGFIDDDWDTRDRTLVDLAKAVVRMDRQQAELRFVRGRRRRGSSGVHPRVAAEKPGDDIAS